MTRLSVNINKIALLRNSRGSNIPNLLQFAIDCERFGAEGITIHPRPDERHIKNSDVYSLKNIVTTEFNIEGFPSKEFIKMVLEVKPEQCTLVPDAAQQLTSDHGWDTITQLSFLKDTVSQLQDSGIRVSLFIDPILKNLDAAKETGTDRVEFYTGPFAEKYESNPEASISDYIEASKHCKQLQLGVNAGHDLNLNNLKFFKENCVDLLEVSIGHALVKDCLYLGLENTIALYKRLLK